MKPIARFWDWFRDHEASYRSLDRPEKDALLDALQEQLQRICVDLWFEIGGHPDGPVELVISAEGKVCAFPLVRDVVRSAPLISGWKIVAFKQPQGFDFTTEYADVVVSPDSAWFLPLRSKSDPTIFGVRVGYPQYREKSTKSFVTATYILLDAGLGELASAMHIQHVEACLLPSRPEEHGYLPIKELPGYLASRGARIDGVRYLVQPGGSVRDADVTEAADEHAMCMAHSGLRLFYH